MLNTKTALVTATGATTYDRLKLLILQGQISRGEPLVERSMAERLGVSRTPVRETIVRLEKEGLVRIIEGKGAFVASYTIEDLVEIYYVREGLEPIAARLACPRIRLEELSVFEEEFNRYRAEPTIRDEDPGAWQRLGRDFHNVFIRASGNNRLIQIMEGMQDQVELYRGLHRTISPHVVSQSTIGEHLEILNALKERNQRRAERAVRQHLQNGLRYRLDGLWPGR